MRVATRSTTSIPTFGVVARKPLADVVQERADEEQVGAFHRVGQLSGQRRRFEQVPVDGEGVVGVALGLVADGTPLGYQAAHQAVLVERLEFVDGRRGPGRAARRTPRGCGRPKGRPVVACGRPVGAANRWAMGWSSSAAVVAKRRGREESLETGALGVRAISPSTSTMSGPRSAGAPGWPASGAPRRKRRRGGGVGSHRRRRRHTSSLTQAIWRPAVDTASMSASASENSSASATWSWSWSSNLSCSRRGHAMELHPDRRSAARSASSSEARSA